MNYRYNQYFHSIFTTQLKYLFYSILNRFFLFVLTDLKNLNEMSFELCIYLRKHRIGSGFHRI